MDNNKSFWLSLHNVFCAIIIIGGVVSHASGAALAVVARETIPTTGAETTNGDKRQNESFANNKTSMITIAGKVLPIFVVTNTFADSGNAVARYRQLIYGHNTANVFGGLRNLATGATFSINEKGKAKTYQIKHTVTMTKARTADFMTAITYARFMGVRYDMALMTCAGEARPNRDATHRLVIFADAI